MEHKKTALPWPRLVAGVLLGALLLMVILPNVGCVLNGSPPYPKFYAGMWHFGKLWFYPDALFYIGYFMFATAAIIIGALRKSKLELVGWALLGLTVVGMLLDS